MKEKVFVSVVLYACNDEETVGNALFEIDQVMHQHYENYEIILVNDGSHDRTLDRARSATEGLRGTISIINLSRKHGTERAMTAGLNKSMGDFVFEIDSTSFDFPIEIIPALQKKAKEGFDIVTASSHKTSVNSLLFYKFVNKMSYLNLDLSTESIRLVSRRALNAMLNLREKVRYRKALYAFTGFAKAKIQYDSIIKRGQRKLNRENITLALDVIVSFSNFGLKLAHYLSLLFFLFSIFMGAYALYNYLYNKDIVEGWTTLMILISTGFAGLFFIIGMLGEYISRILIETQNRPLYSTKSTELYREKLRVAVTEQAGQEVASTK